MLIQKVAVAALILLLTRPSWAGRPDDYELEVDWLLNSSPFVASVDDDNRDEIVLTNDLVRRVFRLEPNFATVALDDLMTGESLLRGVRPEARLKIDGQTYDIGGLIGQPDQAYLTDAWLSAMKTDPAAFRYVGHRKGQTKERFTWKRTRHHAPGAHWPPPGVSLQIDFAPPENDGKLPPELVVTIHYELYDGLPALSKWLTVQNRSSQSINVDEFTNEILAVVPHESPVEMHPQVPLLPPKSIHVETDYAFGGFTQKNSSWHSVQWRTDPEFHTQVNYLKQTPCLLETRPRRGPDQTIEPGESWQSFRTFELIFDSSDRERRGLAVRQLYRTIAPWVTENPLILHVVGSKPDIVRDSIDQAAECGFEMVSLSFGSGLNMEDDSPENRAKFRLLAKYAQERRIQLGGYSLLSSRRVGGGNDIVSPSGEKPKHGNCPALASPWGQDYFRKLRDFFEETGFQQFTHDGSYPGDWDTVNRPPLQKGLNDSQWVQWRILTDFYKWLRARGVYVRVPDYYYLQGANECGMGYREVNWSLPRVQQQIHTRLNIFDGTWQKTPSMGWMFVPLTQYHGGGVAATIEPLAEHLPHYETMMASNLLLGVQAVYRGRRLYDTDKTKKLVQKMVALYKQHRDILESDLIHVRRADGRRLDAMLHVNPRIRTKGFLAVFNPLPHEVSQKLRVPLYYTGIADQAVIRRQGGDREEVSLDEQRGVWISLTLPANGYAWYTIE